RRGDKSTKRLMCRAPWAFRFDASSPLRQQVNPNAAVHGRSNRGRVRRVQPMTAATVIPAVRLVADALAHVETLDGEQFAEELKHEGVVLVDLREQAEREAHGAIPGAVHIPRGMLEFCADPSLPVHADELTADRRILLYCARGSRSALAAMTLMTMGFPFVAHLAGGFPSWVQAGGAVDTFAAETAPWTTGLARAPARA